ncbi:MAG: MoxR family ATPase [Planctomycetales bacterium]|nr:MoxR family ATPase [Planctomycetales bacterium]
MSLVETYRAVRGELEKVVFGQDEAIEFTLAALFSCGHVLLEGPPGVSKTLLVRSLAAALNLNCQRVQMTSDLLPTDLTGASIYREDLHSFEFRRGPLFANFILADEINRASARTQSALLEAMQEAQITYDGATHPLPLPFVVFATQNPIEQEGTYPLPLAQLDRFMFKISVGYPDAAAEQRVLREHHATAGMPAPEQQQIAKVADADQIVAARKQIRETHIRDEIIDYVQRLLHATRDDDLLSVGASPRSGLMLLMAAKSLARFAGRDFVTPDDIKSATTPTMRHRIVLTPGAELQGTTADEVLANLMESVEAPR